MKQLIYTCFLLIVITSSCREKSNKDKVVAYLEKDDPALLALKDTAQKRMPQFINRLNTDINRFRFIIKSDFKDGNIHEHMWSRVIEYKDNEFKSVFADSAYDVKNVFPGDTVSINVKDVEDWAIYNKHGTKVAGFFSEKYLKSKLYNK